MKPICCHSTFAHRAHILFSSVTPTSIIHVGPTSVSGIRLMSRHYVRLPSVLDIGPISTYLLNIWKEKHDIDFFLKYSSSNNIANIDYETGFRSIQKTVQYCIPSHNWWSAVIIVSQVQHKSNHNHKQQYYVLLYYAVTIRPICRAHSRPICGGRVGVVV